MKKVISYLLLIITVLSLCVCFTSCSRVDDVEAKSIVTRLVQASYELNIIFYGEGLETDGDMDSTYSWVSENAKYKTKDALVKKTKEIYSNDYSNDMIDVAFGSNVGSYESARYRSTYDKSLLLKKNSEYLKNEEIATYDFKSIQILKNSRTFIVANIMTNNFGENNKWVEITLIYDDTVEDWRLDSATY